MKKILTAFMLCFISIMFVGCGNINKKATTASTNENTKEKTNLYEGWEYVGNIKSYYKFLDEDATTSPKFGKTRTIYLRQWIKVVGGKKYYLVGLTDDITLAKTPESNIWYAPGGEQWYNECLYSKYMIIFNALDVDLEFEKINTKLASVYFDLM